MPYKDPEKRREAFRKYYKKNTQKVLEKNKKWAKDNPEKAREISNRSYAHRTGEMKILKHDTIDEALEYLTPQPEPDPETLANNLLKELKEGLK